MRRKRGSDPMVELLAVITKSQFGGDPARPYNGNGHTFAGPRGRRMLSPQLTLRDVGDVIYERYNYLRTLGNVDPEALAQAVLCVLEEES